MCFNYQGNYLKHFKAYSLNTKTHTHTHATPDLIEDLKMQFDKVLFTSISITKSETVIFLCIAKI